MHARVLLIAVKEGVLSGAAFTEAGSGGGDAKRLARSLLESTVTFTQPTVSTMVDLPPSEQSVPMEEVLRERLPDVLFLSALGDEAPLIDSFGAEGPTLPKAFADLCDALRALAMTGRCQTDVLVSGERLLDKLIGGVKADELSCQERLRRDHGDNLVVADAHVAFGWKHDDALSKLTVSTYCRYLDLNCSRSVLETLRESLVVINQRLRAAHSNRTPE